MCSPLLALGIVVFAVLWLCSLAAVHVYSMRMYIIAVAMGLLWFRFGACMYVCTVVAAISVTQNRLRPTGVLHMFL